MRDDAIKSWDHWLMHGQVVIDSQIQSPTLGPKHRDQRERSPNHWVTRWQNPGLTALKVPLFVGGTVVKVDINTAEYVWDWAGIMSPGKD